MTQGLTKSNPGLCQVRPCEHEHPSCLESSLELEPDTHPLNSEHTLSVPEISQHKGLARQERAARTTDSFNVQKYGSAKSMRRMVPAEIWDTIFCYAIYDYSLTLRNRTLNSLALKFSQVCAPWRAVVIGSPSLWSSISIDLSSFSSKMTVTLQMYLKRSEGRLLNLWISLSRDRVECLGNARDAWRLLAPHLSRCRTLVWDVDDVKLLPEVYNLAFPNLVSFQDWHFRIVDVNGLALPPDWFWTAVSSAPQLSRVAFDIPLPLSWLPYSNLVSLDARYVCMFSKIFFHVLPKCAALRSLTVGSPGIDDGNTSQLAFQDSIEIPSLRHLAVDDE
ncbi:hypothetical protein PQX77_008016 [Marasmius sp. AFHP31]|nr:hypothetical protein PQX77_008016 [Marasmius sp. AFHP31]